MKKLTLNEVMDNTIWVAKMNWGRITGTYKEIERYAQSEDCRDHDVCCKQPTAELQHFWDSYNEYCDTNHKWMTVQQYYPIYAAQVA